MRILNTTLALAATLALCGCPIGGSSTSTGGGDLACSIDANPVRATCTTSPNVHTLTALETLNEMKASFEAQFTTVTWMGGITGLYIGRDGKSLDKGPVITVGGYSMENGSGWTGNFCNEQGAVDDSLNYDTTDGKCTALRTCLAVNCNAVTPHAFPAIDSPAAVEAAFPTDATGNWYSVTLVMDIGAYWTVSRLAINGATADTKKVDVTTGAVIP